MTQFRQLNFSAGEISPNLYARVDQTRYATGLRRLRNFNVAKAGGVTNRSGTKYVCTTKQAADLKLVPFIFSREDSYVLELGDEYMRFVREGNQITETAKTITAATAANPVAITTSSAHGYSDGDRVTIADVVGMVELNGIREFTVASATGTTFTLSGINGTTYTTYVSGGSVARIYELDTPWADTDLPLLKYAQSNDVMTFTHPDYPPYELTRAGHASWTLAAIDFGPENEVTGSLSAAYPVGTNTYFYRITGIDRDTGEESLPGPYNNSSSIQAITNANPAVVTASGHGYQDGDEVTFLSIGGMTTLNGNKYLIDNVSYTTASAKNIVGATSTDPIVITSTAHGYSTGYRVLIEAVGGMTAINDQIYTITVIGADTFSLNGTSGGAAYTSGGTAKRVTADKFELLGVDSTAYGVYTSGGSVYRTWLRVPNAEVPTSTAPIALSVAFSRTFILYNVYRASQNGAFGLIGVLSTPPDNPPVDLSGTTLTFLDIGLDPDLSLTPPEDNALFESADDYPACVTYYQQRQIFGGSNDVPNRVAPSQVGNFTNHSKRSPLLDSDAFTFNLVGRRQNQVMDMIDVGRLLVLTTDGEWIISGGTAGELTPTTINARQYTYNGANAKIAPMIANGSVLYVQERGNIVRDLVLDELLDKYQGNDLTVFADHLFKGNELVDAAYQKVPNSVAWFVRDDGILLACTYIREHQIVGWSWIDFYRESDTSGGTYNVCSIPEGKEDVLYLIVHRAIGTTIERMETRDINEYSISDFNYYLGSLPNPNAVFVDSYTVYDGRNADENMTVTISGGTDWDEEETVTLTMSSALFRTGTADVGRALFVEAADGLVYKLTVESVTSTTIATARPDRTLPDDIQATATSYWAWGKKVITGLWHLNGEDVSIVAEGGTLSNPNVSTYATHTVAAGAVTLADNHYLVYVGLPYASDFETLDADLVQGETMMGKGKCVTEVTLMTHKSRGIWVGERLPARDDSQSRLFQPKALSPDQPSGVPPAYFTQPINVPINGSWNLGGRIVVTQLDPQPLTILAVAPSIYAPIRRGGQDG